jgi:hypothetical protein
MEIKHTHTHPNTERHTCSRDRGYNTLRPSKRIYKLNEIPVKMPAGIFLHADNS